MASDCEQCVPVGRTRSGTGTDVAPRGARTDVRLELFDGFRLDVDGERVDPLISVQRLLAFLGLQGPVPRVVVAGTLWSNVSDEQARASLRTTAWRANRLVPGLVSANRGQLALADFVRLDVDELAEQAAGVLGSGTVDRHDEWTETSRLWRGRQGELLPGWYDDWVLFERERLRQLRLHALEATTYRMVRRGKHASALAFALEAVRTEPLRESAHRAMIVVHLAEENHIEAVRAYIRFRGLVRSELGVEPSEQLGRMVFDAQRRATSGAA